MFFKIVRSSIYTIGTSIGTEFGKPRQISCSIVEFRSNYGVELSRYYSAAFSSFLEINRRDFTHKHTKNLSLPPRGDACVSHSSFCNQLSANKCCCILYLEEDQVFGRSDTLRVKVTHESQSLIG